MAALVKPKTCSRCKGTGLVSNLVRRGHLGVPGLCFKCNGDGVVEGDRATLAAAKAADAAWHARWAVVVAWFATQPQAVRDGYNVLEVLEFERTEAAQASIAAGHPGVAAALADYGVANGARCWELLNARRVTA